MTNRHVDFQTETDMAALPSVLGLELVRYYNSLSGGIDSPIGIVGRGWRVSYETRLSIMSMGDSASLTIDQADGTVIKFRPARAVDNVNNKNNKSNNNAKSVPTPDLWQSIDGHLGSIRFVSRTGKTPATATSSDEYIWTWGAGAGVNSGRQLTFNRDGQLLRIAAPTGEFVSLDYTTQGWLNSVTDPQGRRININYMSQTLQAQSKQAGVAVFKGVQSIETPVGLMVYRYGTPPVTGSAADSVTNSVNTKRALLANLASVEMMSPAKLSKAQAEQTKQTQTQAQGIQRHYHYEDARNPTLLTGITIKGTGSDGVAMNQRIVTWGYDAYGRANLSVKGEPARLATDAQGKVITPKRLAVGTGIEQVTLKWYGPEKGQDKGQDKDGATVIQTNSLGQETRYRLARINNELKLMQSRGAGCASCAPVNIQYGYDRLGRLIEQTPLDDKGQPQTASTTQTKLDALGRIEQISVGATRIARYEYEGDSTAPRLIARPSVVAGKEFQVRMSYNSQGQVLKITESGYSPLNTLDDRQNNREVIERGTALERSTSYQYQTINSRTVITQIDGPLANGPKGAPSDSDITRYEWDSRGDRVVKIIYPMGLTTKFEYDSVGGNAAYRLAAITATDGVRIAIKYSLQGAAAEINRAGAITLLRHDALNHATRVVSASGEQVKYEFNSAGRISSVFDQQNNRIALARNTENELSQAQLLNPDGSISQQGRKYLGSGELGASNKDPVLANIRQLIDSVQSAENISRPDAAIDPMASLNAILNRFSASAQTTLRLDKTEVTDIEGRITTYWHNDFDQLVAVQSPVTGKASYQYNPAGQLITRIQNGASKAQYARDAAGRVVAMTAMNAQGQLEENAQISWGKSNKPSKIIYLAGDEQFEYDEGARLMAHTQRVDKQSFALTYEYSAAGQLVAKVLPNGQRLSYRYRDATHANAGLLESIWLEGRVGFMNRPVVENMNAAANRFTQRTFHFGNGLTNEVRLDPYGRIISAGNVQVGQTQLTYEQNRLGTQQGAQSSQGPRISQNTAAKALELNALADEPLAVRLNQSTILGQYAQAEFTRTAMNQIKGQTTQWFGSPADLKQHATVAARLGLSDSRRDVNEARFDQTGRQFAQGADQFVYDSLSRLIRFDRNDGRVGEASTVASYRYNLFGQRVAKAVANTDGKTQRTTYYFYDGSQLVAEITDADSDSANQYIWINDKPVGLIKQEHLFAVHTDHRNAPVAVTDQARRVVWQAKVADFLHSVPAGLDNDSRSTPSLGKIEFNLRGSNQYFDTESGLHNNTHRYYDPIAQRYLTPDPMGLAVGPDLYAFALNNPHTMSDPLGLAPASTKDWSKASYEDKFLEIITRAVPLVPGEIGAALQELVKPENLATMGAVLAGFTALQATPIGWIADLGLIGFSIWSFGSGIIELVKGFIELDANATNAKCDPDITAAAKKLSKRFVTGTGEVIGGIAGVWGARTAGGFERISSGIKTLLAYGKKKLGPQPRAVVIEGAAGTPVAAATLQKFLGGTFKNADMPGFQWAAGISRNFKKLQGDPWEVLVQSSVAGAIRLGNNFKAFDHAVALPNGKFRAVSSKTLDTLTDPRLRSPSSIGGTIRGYVDATISFTGDIKNGFGFTAAQIGEREIQLAIRAGTTAEQWAVINQEVAAAAARGVKIVVSVIAP